MKKTMLVISFLVAAASAVALAEDLAIQTGRWEFVMSGMPMDGVPPAMRAQLEAEMRKPFRSCVTADDIKQLKFGKTNDDDDEDCTVVSSMLTRTGGDVVRRCTGDVPRMETLHVETPTPQALRATISKKAGDTTTTMTISGRWLTAACKE